MSHSPTQLNPSDRFIIKDVIGDTLQGRIYRGIDRLSNKFVAIKETWKVLVELNQCRQGTKIQENYLNEIGILNYLSSLSDCPSTIINILSSWDEQLCYMYAMEYCDCSLFNYIKKIHEKGHMKIYCNSMQKLPQRTMNYREAIKNPYLKYVQRIFIKLAHSVSYLHSNSIVHLDLSLENIMLNNLNNNHINNPCIKIIDFGLSKFLGENNSNNNKFMFKHRCGKLSYMAPEVFMDNTFYDGRKADIWSLGVILFIMLIGTHLVDKPTINDSRFCYIIKNGIKPLLKNWRRLRLINDDALDLLNKIFVPESNRIDMKQLLSHPFLNPNRYIIETNTNNNNNTNHIDSEMYENDIESTPTPSLAPSIADSSITDNTIDYQMDERYMMDDEHKSDYDNDNNTYPLYGLDINQQMNDNNDNNDNDNNTNTCNDNSNNINIEARVESKISLSEPLDFINPRIGRDGMFKFGLSLNNNNNNSNNQQKYEF